jgi:hypothetical protein
MYIDKAWELLLWDIKKQAWQILPGLFSKAATILSETSIN